MPAERPVKVKGDAPGVNGPPSIENWYGAVPLEGVTVKVPLSAPSQVVAAALKLAVMGGPEATVIDLVN